MLEQLMELAETFVKLCKTDGRSCFLMFEEGVSPDRPDIGPRLRINHIVAKEQIPMPLLNCINIMGLSQHLQEKGNQFHTELAKFLLEYDPNKVAVPEAANDAISKDNVVTMEPQPPTDNAHVADGCEQFVENAFNTDGERYVLMRDFMVHVFNDEEPILSEREKKIQASFEALREGTITNADIDEIIDNAMGMTTNPAA